ncbi:MAG: carbamoyltransferase C-terminal domain-containing protein, partial [Pirellulales bacterium]
SQKRLVLAGGVALTCVANGRVLRDGPFAELWIQPAAGDAGGALGSALFVWHQLLERPRQANPRDSQRGSLLGPRYRNDEIAAVVGTATTARRFDDEGELIEHVARLLAQEKVIGWFQGRMEFGPRALGARSILGDARSPKMQSVMNLKIKFRESFRPFAPCVLAERADEWFALDGHESPYMLLVAPVRDEHRTALGADERKTMRDDADLCRRVNVTRSTVPAITHVDYSARVQTVSADRNARLHRLLTRFHGLTGCPVLVNTSFNVRGEPIVCTPAEAYRCFLATDMDALVLEDYLVLKPEGAESSPSEAREEYLAQFQLD